MLIKKHRKLFIFFIIVIVLSSASIAGYIFAQNEPRIVRSEDTAMPSSIFVDSDNAKISEDARVTWDYEYKMCGHHAYVTRPVDDEMTGLTFSELQQAYPDVRIVSFEADELVLKKTFDCYCPDHYILKRLGDALAIYRTSLGTDAQYLYLEIPIDFDEINDDQKKYLIVGKVFNSLGDLEAYLEDIET